MTSVLRFNVDFFWEKKVILDNNIIPMYYISNTVVPKSPIIHVEPFYMTIYEACLFFCDIFTTNIAKDVRIVIAAAIR